MTIDEGEKKFKKRWNTWTEAERIEFVKALTGDEPHFPIYLNLACAYWQHLPDIYEQKMGINIKARAKAAGL